jgi:nicotinamide phosphoribosyltransferase
VIRPDSGYPPKIVRRTLEQLDAAFGHTMNSKGYRVLNHVRVIQGDGINPVSIREILAQTLQGGYSASNVTFGMGGALLQQVNRVNRDTQKFAMKLSEVTILGEHIPVFKDPVTDPGKRSKAGRLDLIETGNGYETIVLDGPDSDSRSVMRMVFENGEMLVEDSMDEIRKRVKGDIRETSAA